MTATSAVPAFDFSDFDRSVRIQDDLFRHVNGTWLATAEIPPDKPRTGAFIELRDQAEEAVRDIITTLEPGDPGAEQTKIADLYASFMDADALEAAGAGPLQDPLRQIDTIDSPADLVHLLGSMARRSVAGLVAFEAESDPGTPDRYVMFAGQSGIGLPDEEYYRLESYAEIREQYRGHIAAMLELAGRPDSAAAADRVLNLETQIAATHWDKVKCRDLRLMYNLMSLDEFVASAPRLHWREFMAGAQIDDAAMADLVVTQPSFFTDVAELLTPDRPLR